MGDTPNEDCIMFSHRDSTVLAITHHCFFSEVSGIKDRRVKLPCGSRTMGAKVRKIEQAVYELTGNLDRQPTEAEIADHLNLKIKQYRELLDQVQKRVYISFNDQWARVAADESIEEKLDDKQPDPSIEAGNRDLQDLIRARLANMNPKQQKVIAFYYYEGLRFRDIAEIMEITESRVCQIHTEAVLSLRSFIKRIETTGAKII